MRRALCHFPSIQNHKPGVKRAQPEEVQQTWLKIYMYRHPRRPWFTHGDSTGPDPGMPCR
ncbi:hypothetical protein SBA3_30016 [Candidatus Sulfopaludibacter sp. SbA3]|nr:hypothetical protein SBA3_30016 [Candidatus Sulfopaludibacter sp. SbA3]